ncbi:M16 family metallopeptidase [Enterovibrio coralii]|uniref:Peptidase M16 n=1 Tax=Enterovibrio coralii TaxID=294935 RepID=A0A135I9W5_9GAMM|nr:M16 family metallopeptidase [Enterovibrio coralii]KXF82188.1 hypothetical protein ATN88_17575 [Enterovibrio coralii]
MRKIIYPFVLAGLVGCQTTSQAPVPNDPSWHVGQLENGMTYHIYPSDKDDAVSVRLAFNVGSLQETDAQLGYAHFLEHMAFNGSTHFDNNDIDAYFSSIGVTMGHGANAFTGEYQTVYFVDLPNKSSLDRSMTWFADIAYGLNLDAKAIDGEIGVVYGEWLHRAGEGKPYGQAIYEHIASQSQLGSRKPIGTDVSIKSVNKEKLTEFYEKWYQPQLAHIVVSGDVKQQEVIDLLKEKFGIWEKGTTPNPERYTAPSFTSEPVLLHDSGADGASTAYVFDLGPAAISNEEELYEDWAEDAVLSLINKEISETMVGITGNAEGAQVYVLAAGNREYLVIRAAFPSEMRDDVQSAVSRKIANLRDVSTSEEEVGSLRWYPNFKNYVLEADANVTTKERTDFYLNGLLTAYPVQSVDEMMDLRLAWSRYLTREKFNHHKRTLLSSPATIYAFYTKDETVHQVDKSVEVANNLLLEKGKSNQSKGKQFLASATGSGEVVAERIIGKDLYVWSLSNGMEVWYQDNPKAGDEVRMAIGAKGGRSLLTSDLNGASYLLFDSLVLSGVAGLNAQELLIYINDRGLGVWQDITPTRHAFHAFAYRQNLNDVLVLMHHALSEPNFDEKALKLAKSKLTQEAYTFANSSNGIFDQGVFNWLRGDNGAYQFASAGDVMLTSVEQLESVHRAFFNKGNAPALYISANVDANRLKRAVAKNIASIQLKEDAGIPTNTQQSQWAKDVSPVLSTSSEEKNKALSALYVLSDVQNDRDAKTVFIDEMINRIADMRTFNEVREAQSLTYTPSVWELSVDNEAKTGWGFAAVVEPTNAKRATEAFEEIVADLGKGISVAEFDAVSKQVREAMQDNDVNADAQTNMYSRYLFNGWGVDALLDVDKTVESITYDDVNDRVKSIFGANSKLVKGYNMPQGEFAPE